jgi:hypothetical protein
VIFDCFVGQEGGEMSESDQRRQQKRIDAEKQEQREKLEQPQEHSGTFGAAGYESSLGQVVEPETVYGAEAIPREIDAQTPHKQVAHDEAVRNQVTQSNSPSDRNRQKPSQHDQLESLVDKIVQDAQHGISVHLGLSSQGTQSAKPVKTPNTPNTTSITHTANTTRTANTVNPAKSSAMRSSEMSSHQSGASFESLTLDDLQFDVVSRETTYPEQLELSEEQRLSQEPKEIQHLVQMIHTDSHLSRSRAFVREAKAMEKYEPEGAVPVRFHAYYPVYADMNTAQMDSYFSWRTRIRAGQYVHTSVSNAFVYIYELLNGIGADSDLDIYRKLADFEENYASTEPSIEFYLPQWIQDYVVAHHLTGQPVREQFAGRIQVDDRLDRLAHSSHYTDEQVADALLRISGYRQAKEDGADSASAGGSVSSAGSQRSGEVSARQAPRTKKKKRSLGILFGPLAQKDPQILDRVISQAWQAVQNCTATARNFFDVRIAHHLVVPVTLFAHAIYDPDLAENTKLQTDCTVEIDPLCSYRFENGHWYLDDVIPQPDRKTEIRGLLHEIDRLSRIVWKLGRPLKPRGYFPVYTQEITSALQKVRQQEQEDEWKKAHPPITIDLSQLTRIRSDAAGTRDSLLTEEEKQAEAEEVSREQQKERSQQEHNQKSLQQQSVRQQETAQRSDHQVAVGEVASDGIVSRETMAEEQQSEQSEQSEQSQKTPLNQSAEEVADGERTEKTEKTKADEGAAESFDVTSLLLGEPSDADQESDDADSVPDLTEPEQYLLKALVHGDADWKAELRQRHVMASLVADSINDKLFDQIGDSVIETDDDGDPRLVEDYIPDVKQIVSKLGNAST